MPAPLPYREYRKRRKCLDSDYSGGHHFNVIVNRRNLGGFTQLVWETVSGQRRRGGL